MSFNFRTNWYRKLDIVFYFLLKRQILIDSESFYSFSITVAKLKSH